MIEDTVLAIMREVARTPGDGLRVGQVVQRFELVREIGRGGFGIVFEARDTELGRLVAVKAVRPGALPGDRTLEWFRDEAQAAAALNHPNIVTLHDFGVVDGAPYLVLELLRGETLADRIGRGPLPPREAVELAIQIARGLAHAHAAGVVHRDLKPANVFVTNEGRAKVLDFGLASSLSGGTPGYMAPEQVRGERGDGRTDIYALGVTLQMMVRGLATAPAAVEAPASLLELIETLKAPAIEDRPANANAVVDALLAIERELADPIASTAQPFRYLEPFGAEDATWFFGRDRETARLIQMLTMRALVAVVGPSGAGKTSLVAAGVYPRLRARGAWQLIAVRPARDPFAALRARLVEVIGGNAAELLPSAEDLQARPGIAGTLLRGHAKQLDANILVFVDAFEELYTTVQDPAIRRAFAAAIAACADDSGAPVRVVLAMREDFLSRLAEHAELRDLITSNLALIGPPEDNELVEIVRGPAERAGFALEAGLDDDILAALADERAPLPLLQLAASRLWERRDRDRKLLRRDALADLGGIAGVLAAHANDVLRGLTDDERAAARTLLPLLVTAERTRARRDRTELPDQGQLLERLAAGRLVTIDGDTVELAHESLIDRWGELRDWLDADRDTAGLRDRLIEAASHWSERGRPRDLLWTGRTLDDAQRRLEGSPLGPQGRAFLAAAAAAAVRARRLRFAQVAAIVAVAVAVAIGAVIGMRAQAAAAREAESARRDETARADQLTLAQARALLSTDPAAALEALTTVSPAFDRWGQLRTIAADALSRGVPRVLRGKAPLLTKLQFSPDGKLLYATSDSDVVHRWDVTSGVMRGLAGHRGRVSTFSLSKDGKTLVTGGADPDVRVWNTETGTSRTLVHSDGVDWVELDASERYVIVGSRAGWVRRWELATGTSEPIRGAGEPLPEARYLDGVRVYGRRGRSIFVGTPPALDPLVQYELDMFELAPVGGRTLIASADAAFLGQRIRLVDTTTGAMRTLSSRASRAGTSADGRWLAFAEKDMVHLEPVAGGERKSIALSTTAPSIVVSNSGRHVAITSADGGLWLWNVERATLRRLVGHTGMVFGMAFDPAETTLATGSGDATARLWPLEASPARVFVDPARDQTVAFLDRSGGGAMLVDPAGAPSVLDFSTGERRALPELVLLRPNVPFVMQPSAYRFVGAGIDAAGALRTWNANGYTWTFGAAGEPVEIWVHDLQRVVTRDRDGTIWRWVPGHRTKVGVLPPETIPGRPSIGALSPSGTHLASVASDGTLAIWNVDTGERLDAGRHEGGMVYNAIWSADSSLVATTAITKTIRVFDIAARTARVLHRDNPCGAAAFSPSGDRLASCCGPRGIQITNLTTGHEAVHHGQLDACHFVSWSPDGTRVVSRAPGSVHIWDAATGENRSIAVGSHMTEGIATFTHDGKHVVVRALGVYRYDDDLPTEPTALKRELARIMRERIPPSK